jgi:hypothetical protein
VFTLAPQVSGESAAWDDLLILPFAVPDAWVPQMAAHNAALDPLPFLGASGDAILGGPVRALLRLFLENPGPVLCNCRRGHTQQQRDDRYSRNQVDAHGRLLRGQP